MTGDVLFVNQDEVPKLLPMDACMGAMERVLAMLAKRFGAELRDAQQKGGGS